MLLKSHEIPLFQNKPKNSPIYSKKNMILDVETYKLSNVTITLCYVHSTI
jgi:hypothetical protein